MKSIGSSTKKKIHNQMETSKQKWIAIKNQIGSCEIVICKKKEKNLHEYVETNTKINGFE